MAHSPGDEQDFLSWERIHHKLFWAKPALNAEWLTGLAADTGEPFVCTS